MPDRLLRKPWFVRWLIPLVGALVAVSFVLAGFAVVRQRSEAVAANRRLCRAVNLNRTAMRQILQASAAATARFQPDPSLRAEALRLLRHDLELVRPLDCSSLTNP